jgi:type I restriction enzyme S subunit
MKNEEWKEYKLGDIYEVHNGLSKGRDFFGSGFPFLSFSTIFNNWFIPQELDNLVQSTETEQESFSIKAGDVFVTRTSETADELGMSCVALKDYPKATYNGFCKRMRQYNKSIDVYPRYVGYYLRNPNFRKEFQAFAGSMSTRASLTNEALLGLKIKLPSLATQKEIANILSALDDKIELNNAINRNLAA